MAVKLKWWKILTIVLVIYTLIAGLLMPVPHLAILHETIRNLYYHVPMWFGMIAILAASVWYSIVYLRTFDYKADIKAAQTAEVGIVFGILGLLTGMIWANYTWGEPWSNDPKQNASAVAMLIYLAYFVLRGAVEDEDKRAKLSAVYNIFAFCMLIPLLFIIPRLATVDSLHPGNGGNPAFAKYDLDSNMRLVFYPAVMGWTLLAFWLADIKTRLQTIEWKRLMDDNN